MLYFRPDRNSATATPLSLSRRSMLETDAGLVDVLDIGKQQAHAIILITHGLGSIESFEDMARGLESCLPGQRIIAYSRPGRGSSPGTEAMEHDDCLSFEALRLLPALMRALAVTSADLVAHDDGAAIALLLAAAHPPMVRRIVAISPQVHGDDLHRASTNALSSAHRAEEEIDGLGAIHQDAALAIRCWSSGRRALADDPDHVLSRIAALGAPLLLVDGWKEEYGAHLQMAAISARIQGPMQWVILRADGSDPRRDRTQVLLDLICSHLEGPAPLAGKKPNQTP